MPIDTEALVGVLVGTLAMQGVLWWRGQHLRACLRSSGLSLAICFILYTMLHAVS